MHDNVVMFMASYIHDTGQTLTGTDRVKIFSHKSNWWDVKKNLPLECQHTYLLFEQLDVTLYWFNVQRNHWMKQNDMRKICQEFALLCLKFLYLFCGSEWYECITPRWKKNKYFNNSYLEFDGREPTSSILWFINFIIFVLNSICDSLVALQGKTIYSKAAVCGNFVFTNRCMIILGFYFKDLKLIHQARDNWIVGKVGLYFKWMTDCITFLKNMNCIFREEQCPFNNVASLGTLT